MTEKGVPLTLSKNSKCKKIEDHMVVATETAKELYEQNPSNRRLTSPVTYGTDPLENNKNKQEIRDKYFFYYYPSFKIIFQNIMAGQDGILRSAILYHIYLGQLLAM